MMNCYWQPRNIQPNLREPESDIYDFILIGGGFSGLSCARFLKQQEGASKIVVLEKDYIGFGASGRNGGFATTHLGASHAHLASSQGIHEAREAHRFMKEAVCHVKDLS